MSRFFWLGLLLNFSGLGLAEEAASKQSAGDLSQSAPSKTETATSADATPLDASNASKSGTPAAPGLPPESISPVEVSVSNTEIKKESQEPSISNALDSSLGAAVPAPEVLNESSLNGSNSQAPANSSNAAQTESALKAGDATTQSKEPKVFQTDTSSPQAAPAMNEETESVKEIAKESSNEAVGIKSPTGSENSGAADQAIKTQPEALTEGQELPGKQQTPSSTPVYYSPASKIDMAKHKSVYADKGDGKVKFGAWMISLGSAKSNYSKADGYKDFYGSFSNTLDLGVDWFFLRHTYAAAGIGGRFSYYTDKGSRQTATGTKAPGSSSFTVLSNVLTLQGVISPLPWHWIVFKGWAGRQYDSFEETRDNEVSTSQALSETSGEQPKLLISKGKRNGTVKGFSAMFDISFLDSRSIKSMKPALGIDSLYIAPFKEVYEQKTVKGINLTRSLSGVMLVFGSAI